MAGWRIGWITGDKHYLSTVLRVKSNMDSGMFLGLQNAAIEALNNSDEWHENQNNIYQKRKELVCELFDYLDVKYDSNSIGMFLWGKVSNNLENSLFSCLKTFVKI